MMRKKHYSLSGKPSVRRSAKRKHGVWLRKCYKRANSVMCGSVAANASPGAEDSDLEDSQLDCSLAEGGEENLAVEGDTLEDVVDTGIARRPQRHKDSPTPDRESIHIDDMEPVIHHHPSNSSE